MGPPRIPGALLQQLLSDVTQVGPGKSLADKVGLAQTYYLVPDIQATCAVLSDFVSEVKAQAGKKKLTDTQAATITSDAHAIMVAIGCDWTVGVVDTDAPAPRRGFSRWSYFSTPRR